MIQGVLNHLKELREISKTNLYTIFMLKTTDIPKSKISNFISEIEGIKYLKMD
jgi:hypothetical protein